MIRVATLILFLLFVNNIVGGEEYAALKAAIEELRSKLESVWALEAKAVAEAEAARIAEAEAMSAAISAVEAEKGAAAMLELIKAAQHRAELKLSAAEEMKKAYEAAVVAAENNVAAGKIAKEDEKAKLVKLKEELKLVELQIDNLEKLVSRLRKEGLELLAAARAALDRGETHIAQLYSKEATIRAEMIKDKEKQLELNRIIREEAERRVKLGEALVKAASDRVAYLEELSKSIKSRYEKEVAAASLAAKEVESLKQAYLAAESKFKVLVDARRGAYAFLKKKAVAAKEASARAEAEVKLAKAEEEQLRLKIMRLQEEYKRAIEAIREAERLFR